MLIHHLSTCAAEHRGLTVRQHSFHEAYSLGPWEIFFPRFPNGYIIGVLWLLDRYCVRMNNHLLLLPTVYTRSSGRFILKEFF